MSISGIGSQNTYIYNLQTKKLATTDGSKDAFVDYFNGDISEEDNSLNGFDVHRKNDIEEMIGFWMDSKDNVDPARTEFEITTEVVDAAENRYFVDGEKAFTGYHMGFFGMISQTELSKALGEKLLASFNEKYNETPEQNSGVNGIKDAVQNAAPAKKSEEGRCRFAIPAWLENKALREYEEWLSRPLSERESRERRHS